MLNKTIRILTWLILIIILLLFVWFSVAFPDEIIRYYDKDGERTGYSRREGNRETRYDENWNRQGYSVYEGDRADRFDDRWERQGSDVYEETRDGKGEDYEEK